MMRSPSQHPNLSIGLVCPAVGIHRYVYVPPSGIGDVSIFLEDRCL